MYMINGEVAMEQYNKAFSGDAEPEEAEAAIQCDSHKPLIYNRIMESIQDMTTKYMEIIVRAELEGVEIDDKLSALMDIESADKKFNLRLDDWIEADTFNFLHDFVGIRNNIDRSDGFPATNFGLFVPRFAGSIGL